MKPFIVMQTDFGQGIATSTMEGVILSLDPDLRLFHSSHDIQPFNTYEASYALFFTLPFWPAGSIFISVVDPGVGTSRKACVAKLSNGSYVVTPDNGSLTHIKESMGIEAVREIDQSLHRLPSTRKVDIFHGRDLFAYCAGKLASGLISFDQVGPAYPTDQIILHPRLPVQVKGGEISGILESADRRFGLVCSNIPYSLFEDEGIRHGHRLKATIRHQGRSIYQETLPFLPSFGHVDKGEALLMVSETQQIQLAINQGNLSLDYDLASGPDWTLHLEADD